MSIASEITRINNNISAAYTACNNKGATLPQTQNSANLATTIGSIPTGGTTRNWSEIGYSDEPEFIDDGFEYAKTISDNWVSKTSYFNKFNNDKNLVFMPLVDTSRGTNFGQMFSNCRSLVTVPQLNTSRGTSFGSMFIGCNSLKTLAQLDTSSGTSFDSMFSNCNSLVTLPQLNTSSGTSFIGMFSNCYFLTTVPQLNISKATGLSSMFNNCNSLSTESLNNILAMCANATSYTGTKTLYYLGLRSSNYPAATIESLSNYQAFVNAGWTIGY